MRRLTPEQVTQVLQMYRAGEKIEYIAAKFHVCVGTIMYHKRKAGLGRQDLRWRKRRTHVIAATIHTQEELSLEQLIRQINSGIQYRIVRADYICRRPSSAPAAHQLSLLEIVAHVREQSQGCPSEVEPLPRVP